MRLEYFANAVLRFETVLGQRPAGMFVSATTAQFLYDNGALFTVWGGDVFTYGVDGPPVYVSAIVKPATAIFCTRANFPDTLQKLGVVKWIPQTRDLDLLR